MDRDEQEYGDRAGPIADPGDYSRGGQRGPVGGVTYPAAQSDPGSKGCYGINIPLPNSAGGEQGALLNWGDNFIRVWQLHFQLRNTPRPNNVDIILRYGVDRATFERTVTLDLANAYFATTEVVAGSVSCDFLVTGAHGDCILSAGAGIYS